MPPKSKPTSKAKPPANDFDSYLLEGDLSDISNPFRSPSPGLPSGTQPTTKRKAAADDHLGIDSALTIKKRAPVPRVKLDEERLLSKAGIPTLQVRAKRLHLKGKGHEWSDASKLLSLYQFWLDDIYPKAKFLDALGMVEKAGHKGGVVKARLAWIDQGRPKPAGREDGDRGEGGEKQTRMAPIFDRAKTFKTPGLDDDDLFGCGNKDGEPEDDDLDALMAVFGGGKAANAPRTMDEPDDEDLDALMAEVETEDTTNAPPVKSIFGGGKPVTSLVGGGSKTTEEPDEDDLDALMAEAEGTTKAPAVKSIFGGKPASGPKTAEEPEDDDLDALMAEAESTHTTKPAKAKEPASFADDEEAMAEMDGLW